MKFIPLLIGISLGCQSALAADLHVKTDGSDSNSGSSWTDAFQTLQKALSIAVAGDHIWIAEGTYHPDDGPGQTADQRASVFTLTANVEIYGGFPADGSVTNLLDRDPAAHPVILSGEIQQDADPVNNAYHVILADDGNDASNRTILLDGITITGGHADLNDANNNHRGGGILSREALTLRNVIVTGNYALGYGGGASLFVGNCILDQCLFSSNESAGGGGGGAIRLNTSDLTAVDTHFTLNTASNATGDGGAIHCPSNSSLTLTRCEFTANTARYGGGIYKIGSGTLLNCLFSENQAQFGGGIYNGSNLNLTNCAFRANTATSDGGGLFNAPGGTTNLTNCTLRSNQADANGGGFRQNGGTTTLTNTILWDNTEAGTTTAPGAGISVSGTNPFYTYSLIQNQNPTGTGNLDGTDPANDPLFISPTDLRIQLGSPCIDSGNSAANTTPTDLAGNPRIHGTAIDLGAYEFTPLYVKADAIGTGDGTSWADAFPKLQEALAAATSGTTILVAAGTYYPDETAATDTDDRTASFVLIDGVSLLGGFAGNETDLTLRDPAANETILSGDIDQNDNSGGDNSGNSLHVLTADAVGSLTLLDGFTITAGNAKQGSFNGGGLLCINGATPRVIRCSFLKNSAHTYGGAIHNENSSPSLTNCLFSGNSANYGGALFNANAFASLVNCTFQGNSVTASGGANYNSFSSATYINCAFQGNRAGNDGGGMLNANSSTATLANCSFQGNRANRNGGGMLNANSATATLANCIIWNNSSDGLTTSPQSSVYSSTLSSTFAWSHCLVQNWSAIDLGGPDNLDGTDPANNPLFVSEIDPLTAPATSGKLRLLPTSPCLNVGDNTANTTATDLAGNPRIQNTTIDLGAYEGPGAHFVKADATGTGDGSTWTNAFRKLQDALAAATPGQTLFIAAGTYYPDETSATDTDDRTATFLLPDHLTLLGGYAGNETDLSQRDPATNLTTLSGEIQQDSDATNNSYNILTADASGTDSLLDGFTLTAARADGSGTDLSSGAALACRNGANPSIAHCHFQGNFANNGGALQVHSSSPALTDCTFLENTATSYGGAATHVNATATYTRCLFQDNSTLNIHGGAIHINGGSPAFTDCEFISNTSDSGGGAASISTNSTATFTACSFRGNQASTGGGIQCSSSSPVLNNCSFQGNYAMFTGGGIYNGNSSPVLNNCSFQGNNASSAGGAIRQEGGTTSATNCIIWNNAQNSSTSNPGSSVSFSLFVLGTVTYSHCLVQNLNPAGIGNLSGTNPANNPLFLAETDPLTAPTTGGDLRLQPTSPCIDRGDDSANPSTTDLAGQPRHIGTIDLGAYEIPAADLWLTDNDQDGLPWGIENALGTDTAAPTYPSPITPPTFDLTGTPLLTFPKNPAAIPGTVWILERSTDLQTFTEMWRYDGLTNTTGLSGTTFTITDPTNPRAPQTFYRFRATYQP